MVDKNNEEKLQKYVEGEEKKKDSPVPSSRRAHKNASRDIDQRNQPLTYRGGYATPKVCS